MESLKERYLFGLGTIEGFNIALRHFYKTSGVLNAAKSNLNPADMINEYLDKGELTNLQVIPITYSLLVQKLQYSYKSHNLRRNIEDFSEITEELSSWDKVDIVIVYYHPTIGSMAINPKKRSNFERAGFLQKNQLVVIYVKYLEGEDSNSKELEQKAISLIIDLLEGKEIGQRSKEFKSDKKKAPKEKEKEEKPTEGIMVTPKYGIEVTNELFHNGNVEAWKNIIESYTLKYPHLKVMVFHGGEQINDLNALFKWGKVKHGDTIFFCVAGKDIKDISKLRKYLYEGASNRFHMFLKKDVNKPLDLF